MPYNTPAETAQLAIESGAAKASLPTGKALVGGFLAGAYIAFGALLAIIVSAGLKVDEWGGLITLFTGLVFSLGLVLTVIGGAELLTGNMMLVPLAVLARRTTVAKLAINWVWLTIGNLVGSLFVAYFLADKTGLIANQGAPAAASAFTRLSAISIGKALTESDWQIFLRAMGCNWLVCLAVWLALAATDVGGKIIAIVFPITAFVALGFDHVVANMFFLPAAMWVHVPGITIGHVINNLVVAFIGNAVGAGVFVAGAYWYLYAADGNATAGQERPAQSSPSRAAGSATPSRAAGSREPTSRSRRR